MLQKLSHFLLSAEKLLLTASFFLMLGVAAAQIIMRNLFGSGFIWGDDLVKVIVLWVGFLGAAYASRDAKHINIDIISRFLPAQISAWAYRGVYVFTVVLCCVAAYHSYEFIKIEMEDGMEAFLGVPVWATELIIPGAFVVMAWRFLLLALSPTLPVMASSESSSVDSDDKSGSDA